MTTSADSGGPLRSLGSLCTGFGGLDIAAEAVLGPLEHHWYAEFDPARTPAGKPVKQYAAQVCAAHWPDVPNLGDLTAVDWATVPRVDVVCAGFPCTDVSSAGGREGLRPDRWELPDDVGEMPCGCLPMNHKVWCEAVSPLGWSPAAAPIGVEDLADAEARSVAAAEALNERDRTEHPEWRVQGTRTGIWSYIAQAIGILRPRLVLLENVEGLLSARSHSDVEPCPWCLGDTDPELVVRALGTVLADLARLGFDAEWATVPASGIGAPHRRKRVFIVAWPAADPPRIGHRHAGSASLGRFPAAVVAGGAGTDGLTLLPTPTVADSRGSRNATAVRSNPKPSTTTTSWTLSDVAYADRWGIYAEAIARWQHLTGRPAPEPTVVDPDGRRCLNPAFVEWMMGLPAGWVTDHVPGNGALKVLGNGVVWQQAAYAYAELLAGLPHGEDAPEPACDALRPSATRAEVFHGQW